MRWIGFELGKGPPVRLLPDWHHVGMSLFHGTYSHEIVSRSGLPSYVEDRIPHMLLYTFLVALSMLRGTFKIQSIFKICRVWFLHAYVDFGRKSTCATQDRCDLCELVPPSHGCGSWVVHWILSGYHLAVVRSGYRLAIVRSDLVGDSVVRFGYKLVSCTLSRLSHKSVGGTGIWPMTVALAVLEIIQ